MDNNTSDIYNLLSKQGILPSAKMQSAMEEAIGPVVQEMQAIGEGLVQLAQAQQHIGVALDITRLSMYALVKMLVEKNIIQENEWKAVYERDVISRMKDLQKEIMEKTAEAPIANDTQKDEQEPESDVVLPSEKNNVIKFK
jgi:hypothetical protein